MKYISKPRLFPILILLSLYILAFIPRVYRLQDTGVHMDEVIWMSNAKTFIYGLRNFYATQIKDAWWNNRKETFAIGIPALIPSGVFLVLFAGASRFSLHLFSDIVAFRLPVVIVGSLLTPYLYYSFKKQFNEKIALVAAIGYALNPIAISLDRWFLHDSSLTLFSFIAISSYLINWKEGKKSLVPGICLGLAFLSKPNGLAAVIPWLVILLLDFRRKENLALFLWNLSSFFVTVMVLWPQSWYQPIFSIFEYLFRQLSFAQIGLMNFYLGKPVLDPGWTYYFFELGVKNPEVVVISLTIGIMVLLRLSFSKEKKQTKNVYFAIASYLVAFIALITFSVAKPGVRYALPALPWVFLIASIGFIKVYEFLRSKIVRSFFVILSGASLIIPLNFFPNYQMYHNQFVGGAKGAVKIDRISLCVGNKKALEFLDTNGYDGSVYIFGCVDAAPYHSGRTITRDIAKAKLFIVETAQRQVHPDDPSLVLIRNKKLTRTIIENGVETAKVYTD